MIILLQHSFIPRLLFDSHFIPIRFESKIITIELTLEIYLELYLELDSRFTRKIRKIA
jgi:hypothetical protein